jgi:hypothetical protein
MHYGLISTSEDVFIKKESNVAAIYNLNIYVQSTANEARVIHAIITYYCIYTFTLHNC